MFYILCPVKFARLRIEETLVFIFFILSALKALPAGKLYKKPQNHRTGNDSAAVLCYASSVSHAFQTAEASPTVAF